MSRSPYVLLSAAVVCVSVGSILVRLASAPALAVSFHRVFLASLLTAPFAARPALRAWRALSAKGRIALIASGLALALHFATWITSLAYTSVAASVLLVNTTPLFTVAMAWTFLGEVVTPRVLAAIALALAGAVVIAASDWSGGGSQPLLGDALAMLGALTLSIYHVIGRGLRAALPLDAYVFAVWTTAAVFIALMCAGMGVSLTAYPPRSFAVFLALAVVPTLLGHGLVNRSLRVLPAPTVGLFLLGEPVGATILAALLLGETPGAGTLAGGTVILAALALVVAGRGA